LGRVTVKLPARHYPVLVGRGALLELPLLVRGLGATTAAVIGDRAAAEHWAPAVLAGLAGVGVRSELLAVEPGERSKSLATLERTLAFLEDVGLDRSGLVVALGGGVVGDLAGFAAAIWLRGVRCVQVPTTLLAMVDASVGGKTGIDTVRTKNAIGSFTQPAAVVADLATLDTLPEADYRAAFAEVVKYAVAMDRELAGELLSRSVELLERQTDRLEPVVTRCVELKAGVVVADELDRGPRAILNYGHTLGHALESASGYGVLHGRAVAFGMEGAARMAERMGLCGPELVSVQESLLEAFGLPGELPRVEAQELLSALPRDKKSSGGRIRWVLPRELGRAQVGVMVPDEVVVEVVRDLLS
jgi:3-dehydroquinate synthase